MNKGSVLVTGALGGIGVSLCDYMYKEGYHVIGVDRKANETEKPYPIIKYDISTINNNPDKFKKFKKSVENVMEKHPLKGVINNAAIQIIKNTSDITWDDWEKTFGTNVFAPFFIVRAFMEELKKNQGAVVNMASIHARLTKKDFTAYSTSKGALVSLTRAMALDLAPDIRVNAVMPAATDTPMLREGFKYNTNGYSDLKRYHPLQRIADPEEVAKAVKFLLQDDASFITGSTIWVDGGIGGVLNDPVFAR